MQPRIVECASCGQEMEEFSPYMHLCRECLGKLGRALGKLDLTGGSADGAKVDLNDWLGAKCRGNIVEKTKADGTITDTIDGYTAFKRPAGQQAARPAPKPAPPPVDDPGFRGPILMEAAVGTVELPLTQGKVALIDAGDFERVRGFSWYAFRTRNLWYAAASNPNPGGPRRLYLHRLLMNAPKGVEVDHKNGNGLDNRRSTNLRLASHQRNICNQRLSQANTSGFKGVICSRTPGVWVAQTKCHGKMIRLGSYPDKVTAAYAYDLAAIELFGQYARCNLLTTDSDIPAITAKVERDRLHRRFTGAIHAKLRAEDVRLIRTMHAAGQATIAQLSAQFGVHRSTIEPLLKGKTWKNVA